MKTKQNENYLIGKLLLAMPGMGDPRFDRAVILICAHDENGAMGLVINHTAHGMEFKDLLDQLNISSNIEINPQNISHPVMSGGPVESTRGFLLHSNEFKQAETVPIDNSFCVTGTIDALKEVAKGKGPENMLFILGYAGWNEGQLDSEIQQNAWLVVDSDPDIIFNSSPEEKWQMAIEKLGIGPGMLSGETGNA